MYYNEKLINGIWHYKTLPRMEWKPMSALQLANKIAAQERELNKLRLSDVSQQRELLIDFYSKQNGGMNGANKHAIIRGVDNYIESINCG